MFRTCLRFRLQTWKDVRSTRNNDAKTGLARNNDAKPRYVQSPGSNSEQRNPPIHQKKFLVCRRQQVHLRHWHLNYDVSIFQKDLGHKSRTNGLLIMLSSIKMESVLTQILILMILIQMFLSWTFKRFSHTKNNSVTENQFSLPVLFVSSSYFRHIDLPWQASTPGTLKKYSA